VTYEELELYLASVFKVLYETSPALRKQMDLETSPDNLARSTAQQCFEDAGGGLASEAMPLGIDAFSR